MRKTAQAATTLIKKTVDLNFKDMFPLLSPSSQPVCILHRGQGKHSFQPRNPQSKREAPTGTSISYRNRNLIRMRARRNHDFDDERARLG